jgi:hypothetical protein
MGDKNKHHVNPGNHQRLLWEPTLSNLDLENLDRMDRFLQTYNHPKLNQEDINHLTRSITQRNWSSYQEFPKKEKSKKDGFSAEFYQTFKEQLIPTLLKLFHEIEREATLPNLFYEAIF